MDYYLKVSVDTKGHFVVLEKKTETQNIIIYSVNDVIIQTQKYYFFPRVNKQAGLQNTVYS